MKRAKKIIDIDYELNTGNIIEFSDVHIPFHDPKAVDAVIRYIEDNTPTAIIMNGDIMDFYMLSRFTKGEGRNPMEEIKMCQDLMQRVRNAAPKAEIFYIIGNHETRLEKSVLTKAPELESLIEDVFTILNTEKYNIRGCASVTVNDTFVFKHGTLLGSKSGLSAIKEMENSYMSGCSGHTHRLSKYIARKAGKKFVWLESGCLCDLNPEYVVNPNWQQGFCVFEFVNGKLKNSEAKEIEDGEIL